MPRHQRMGGECVSDQHTIFTREALKAQDGKEVPLKDIPGPEGRVIGKAILRFDEESSSLIADFEVTDPMLKKLFEEGDLSVSWTDADNHPPDTNFSQSY